ncbi:MAG: class I SAM-dependent methyltransferase [Deltaproteobacteria bacterium]|nr:class I SAM-dependent methyltransferase [Deltaproteobacteria bacterium]
MKQVHSTVLDILKNNRVKGLLLDVAGGDGGFAVQLNQIGFKVVFCDMYPPSQVYTPFVQADMNQRLPFQPEQFQTITCMESLQYFENHKLLFREFKRIIKKDGQLVLTMPNILNISSRIFFLNRGYFKYFKPFKKNQEGREWDKIMYSPLSFVEIFQLLHGNGFQIETLAASQYRYSELPMFLLYKGVYTLMSSARGDTKKSEMLNFLYSKEILLGDHIIVIARKSI